MTQQKVLFVCLHGAAKSVLAAADFERLAKERRLPIAAESAGTEPDPEIAPKVLAALKAEGVDLSGQKPRLVTREMAAGAIAGACFVLGKRAIFDGPTAALAVAALVLLWRFKVPEPVLIVSAGLIGFAIFWLRGAV